MTDIKEKLEQTFIMIKPDGVERGLIGEIMGRLEKKGFQITALSLVKPTKEILEKHYLDLKKKPFFPELIEFMLSGPVVTMIWKGKGIVSYVRKMLGETDPLNSAPGTIRGDFGLDINRNLCHASDSIETAEREIKLWFSNKSIVNYQRTSFDKLLYGN